MNIRQAPHEVSCIVIQIFLGIPKMKVTFSVLELGQVYALGKTFTTCQARTLARRSLSSSKIT